MGDASRDGLLDFLGELLRDLLGDLLGETLRDVDERVVGDALREEHADCETSTTGDISGTATSNSERTP